MSLLKTETPEDDVRAPRLDLVPRLKGQGYSPELMDRRRRWLEEKTGAPSPLVGAHALGGEDLRGNIENPIGAAQIPIGVAGPLHVRGEHADGVFYVPMATTEGAVVRSYERGMAALTRSGGVEARVLVDENRVSPIFRFPSVAAAAAFCRRVPELLPELQEVAASTTRHGRLLRTTPLVAGRRVILDCSFYTADAHGMNMIVKAADAVCRHLEGRFPDAEYQIFSGYSSEKKPTGSLLRGGKGKKVTAGAFLPAKILRAVFRVEPEQMAELWRSTVIGHFHAGSLGFNAHYANGLTAIFIATGQDVANVANCCVGVSELEVVEGGIYASVTLPSLNVATVGGGTGLGTGRECLAMLGCSGAGKALKLAEIVAAAILAGELSMSAAIATDEFVAAHETYGRNRPRPEGSGSAP